MHVGAEKDKMIEDYKESMKESRTLQEYIDQPIDSVHKHVEEEA